MPELPEVETVRSQLAPLVEGCVIGQIEVLDPRWADRALAGAVRGLMVERLLRRGKYLIWQLEREVHLLMHLRMTGTLLFDPVAAPAHTRVCIRLEDGRFGGAAVTHELLFVDPRRFGTGELAIGGGALREFLDARLGLEPFDAGWTDEHLFALTRSSGTAIKPFLLDQRRIAGIGNIYADEALFRAGLHPLRIARNLSRAQTARLRRGVQDVLRAGIDARGAPIDDFRDLDDARGSFQDQFLVHRREGMPCPVCATPVRKLVVGGRGTYVCERCQRRPRPRASRGGALRVSD
ncbi:MAG: bifunctional DNA-formamidopyrimidine glycosylase/DNA-(apurinic or apyrimidinic site) lyase [Solirubrobacteraceae bacterium]